MNNDNRFDEVYDIRLATVADIPMIMDFLKEHWRKDHIMATNRELFDYEYTHGNDVDFVIAIKKETSTLEGIFGFLRCSKRRDGDLWGSMWKVNDKGDNMNLLGIELAKRVYSLTGCHYYCGNGANAGTTVPLRKLFFREKTVKMKQFYWLNNRIKEYRIAEIIDKWTPIKGDCSPDYKVIKFDSFNDLRNNFDIDRVENIPHKDEWYINKRYFEHPIYKYDSYGIHDGSETKAVFFTREIRTQGAAILRIVDYLGNHEMLAGIYDFLDSLVKNNSYEYIDFFEYGIDDDILKKVGFRNREDYNNIIPNYFEPFVRENVDIWAHYKTEGTTFFKADGDQDRPNLVPG